MRNCLFYGSIHYIFGFWLSQAAILQPSGISPYYQTLWQQKIPWKNQENQNIYPFSVLLLGQPREGWLFVGHRGPVNIYAFIQDRYYGSLLGWARINCDLLLENVHKKLKKNLNTVFLQCALSVLCVGNICLPGLVNFINFFFCLNHLANSV